MNHKQQTMSKGFAVLSISNILVKILSLFFVPIMRSEHMLGHVDYSVFATSNTFFAFVYVLATAGLPVAIAKLVSELVSKQDERGAERAFRLARSVMMLIGLVLSALMAILCKPIASLMGMPESWGGILFISPTILVCSVLSAYKGYFQGRKNMNPTAISQVLEQVVHMVVSIVMTWILLPYGVVWAVAGASMGTVAGAVVSLAFMIKQRKTVTRLDYRQRISAIKSGGRDALESVMAIPEKVKKITNKDLVKRIFYYSIPITLNTGIQYAGDMIDTSILNHRLRAGGLVEEVAKSLYSDLASTRQLLNVPTSIISAMCVSILPTMAALHALKQNKEKSLKANEGYKLCYMIAVPMTAAFAVFAQAIFTLLGYGSNYNILMTLSFSVILQGTVHLQSSILQSVNRMFTSTMFLLAGAVLRLGISYVLAAIPSINVYGAVISTYVSYAVPFLLNQWALNKKEKMNISVIGNLWKPCLASVFMVMVGFPVYYGLSSLIGMVISSIWVCTLFAFAITAVLCVAVYGYVMMKIGGITYEDVRGISPALARRWPKKLHRIL